MRQYRNQRLRNTGPTTNNENTAEATAAIPEIINHIPVCQSSLLQSDILK